MTKPSEPPTLLADADMAKAYRRVRFMRALFQIDDPELEQALTVIADRLAAASRSANGS
jgi:hypothetical protein